MTDFEFLPTDLILLQRFHKRAPKQFGHASAGVLNSLAFGNRKESINVMHKKLTIRNDNFLKSSMRVTKAKGYAPINQQQSEFGSIRKARSTGWKEQELGIKSNKTRVATLLGRRGTESNQISPSLRLKQGRKFVQSSDFQPGKNGKGRTFIMIQTLSRRKYKKPFVVRRKNPTLRPGMYKFKSGKIRMIYAFDTKAVRPRRVRWLRDGNVNDMKALSIRDRWGQQVKRQIKFIK